MSNKKEVLHVKSNGLRNELKEIRKAIDNLTDALLLISNTQTHKRYEKDISTHRSIDASSSIGELYDYE